MSKYFADSSLYDSWRGKGSLSPSFQNINSSHNETNSHRCKTI